MLLLLETSTDVCSTGLAENGVLVGMQEYTAAKLHTRLVTATAEQLLRNLELTPGHLTGVAVAGGPGSYTGLRVGISAAKGLCMALGIPLIAVPTLQALAAQVVPLAEHLNADIVPMLDARRMEVFAAVYDAQLLEQQAAAPEVLTAESFAATDGRKRIAVGDGAKKFGPLVAGHADWLVLPDVQASVRGMAQLAHARWVAGQHEDIIRYEPEYLKPPATSRPKRETGAE